MPRRLSWRLEPPKGLISTSKEHVPLCHIVNEEDPAHNLDHSPKVEDEEMLVLPNEGDEDTEDDAVVHGIAIVKADSKTLLRPELAHSVIAVASMDTTLHSVLKEPVHPAVAILLSL